MMKLNASKIPATNTAPLPKIHRTRRRSKLNVNQRSH